MHCVLKITLTHGQTTQAFLVYCLVKGGKLLISILFMPNLDQLQSRMKQRHCVYMNAILI